MIKLIKSFFANIKKRKTEKFLDNMDFSDMKTENNIQKRHIERKSMLKFGY